MPVNLHAVGKKMPGWVDDAVGDYTKRFPKRWQFSIKEHPQAQGSTKLVRMDKEADVLLAAIPTKAYLIALDNLGKQWSTDQLSVRLQSWQSLGKPIVFMIGGADGLHSRCRERANELWSLSALTFPHPLVRVVLVEQLYRAQSLIDGHPYHRGT